MVRPGAISHQLAPIATGDRLKTKVKVPTVRVLMDLLNEEGRGLHSVPADLLSISIFSKGAKAIYMVYVQG
jgi:hypothetical protein